MKKYNSYKETRYELIGEIPSTWTVKRLAYNGTFHKGSGVSRADLTEEGVPVILYGDIYTKYNIKTDSIVRRTSKEIAEKSVQIYCDDLLFTASGETKIDIGKCIVYFGKNEAYASGDVVIYRQNKFDSTFLSYLFNSYYLNISKARLSKGEIVVHIYESQLRNIHFACPPRDEQTQIAKYLDFKTKQIETLITNKQKLIELLQEERTAIINQAVTKGINPKAKLKPSGVEWLGDVPEHWEVKKIKYLGKIVSGYSFKSEDFIEDNGCRVMKISNIQTMNIDWSDESFVPHSFYDSYPNFQIRKGDLVFALTRPIISTGIKAAIVDSDEKILLNQRNAVLKPLEILNVNWMYFLIFNPRFVNYFESLIDNTGQQPNISSTDIANIAIPLPSKQEQDNIINFILAEQKRINTIISKTEQEIELMKEYKTALISEVVTGKVDVRDEVIR